MDICPKCSCIIKSNVCIMCGYKLKDNHINHTFNKNSVFNIFDFIDKKDTDTLKSNKVNIDIIYEDTNIKNDKLNNTPDKINEKKSNHKSIIYNNFNNVLQKHKKSDNLDILKVVTKKNNKLF